MLLYYLYVVECDHTADDLTSSLTMSYVPVSLYRRATDLCSLDIFEQLILVYILSWLQKIAGHLIQKANFHLCHLYSCWPVCSLTSIFIFGLGPSLLVEKLLCHCHLLPISRFVVITDMTNFECCLNIFCWVYKQYEVNICSFTLAIKHSGKCSFHLNWFLRLL